MLSRGRLVVALILFGLVGRALVGHADALPTLYGPVVQRGWNDAPEISPGSARAEAVFAALAQAGASAVAVDVVALVARADSPFLESPRTARAIERERLAWTVERARHHGLRPILRTRVDRLDGGPRDAITLDDEAGWSRFFDQLRAWCTDWARDAEELGFDLFVLPSDLGGTTHREADWRRLVAAVRARYRGPITYGADPTDEIDRIAFWDEFDAIGVASLPAVDRPGDDDLTPRPKPTVWSATDEDSVAVHEIARALAPTVRTIENVAARFGRPVILTGVGYRSVPQAWRVVEGSIDRFAPPDDRDQARAAAGALRAFRDRAWLRGLLWHGVDLEGDDAAAVRQRARGVSIRGKRAFTTVADHWRRPTPDGGGRRVVGGGGAVVSEDSLATSVGQEILRAGGNAVDAAVAMAFVLGVSRPDVAGLGAGGIAVVHDPRRGARTIDFRARAPLATAETFFEDLAAEGLAGAALDGPVVAAVPGMIDGLHAAWIRDGTLAWDRLLEPAFRAAVEGTTVSPAAARAFATHHARLRGYASTRTVFHPEGRRPRAGAVLARPRLAETLLALRRAGPAALQHGPRARRLVEGVQRAGGRWSVSDLATGDAPRRAAATRWPISRDGRAELHTWRGPRPDGLRPPAAWNTREDAGRAAPADVAAAQWVRALDTESSWSPASGVRGDAGTSFAVVDGDGRAVVVHLDLGRPFGCAWVDPESGILLNASMTRFDADADAADTRLVVRPGARVPSAAAPAVVSRDGRVWLVLGGGDDADVLQTLWRRVVDAWPIERAVAAPRILAGSDGPARESTRVDAATDLPVGIANALVAIERLDEGRFALVVDPRTTGLARGVRAAPIRSSLSSGRSW